MTRPRRTRGGRRRPAGVRLAWPALAAAAIGALFWGALLWGAGPSVGAPPTPAPIAERVEQLDQAAKQARERQDYASFRARLLELYDLLNGHPGVVYRLACAEALLGHPQAALAWLGTYADMKITHAPLAGDPALASLRSLPDFTALARRIDANRQPVSHATLAFTLPEQERDMVSEDLAYDPATRTFYVSSMRHRKIVAIDRNGAATDFVPAGQDGLWAVMALVVDAPRRTLWASTAAFKEWVSSPASAAGRSALLRYELPGGKLVKRYDLPPGGDHVLGDMTLDAAGDVFVSDAVSGIVYTVRRDRDALEPLVPAGTFLSPQNPAATPDGKRLFVADYALGIGIVDVQTRRTSWLPHPKDLALIGIDGLYLAGGSLFAVQNGTEPNRVIRLRLDPALTRVTGWEVIESGSPQLGVPTHGVVAEGAFYFLGKSGWDRLQDDGSPKPGAQFEAPVVLRLPLS